MVMVFHILRVCLASAKLSTTYGTYAFTSHFPSNPPCRCLASRMAPKANAWRTPGYPVLFPLLATKELGRTQSVCCTVPEDYLGQSLA